MSHWENDADLESLIERLNPAQREAVMAPPGPILILAGAGSGKTRVLTHRIAWMIHRLGIRPWNILAVTFTNKAAEEMAHRTQRLLPESAGSLEVTTFHKAAARILRRNIERLGYTSGFTIYDDSDTLMLLKRVLEELNLTTNAYDPRAFRSQLDRAKNRLEWPHQVEAPTSGPLSKLPAVYTRYQEKLKAANALDFGDLLLLLVKLLEEHPDVRAQLHERYRHVLIDEYQDTNHAQYRLTRLLTPPETSSLCVVGDEDQSIYAFRGADISNILNFNRDFPDAQVIKLEQNYRSTNIILKAATGVVARNEARIGKTLWTDRGEGEPLQYLELDSDVEEASRIAEEILRLRTKVMFQDMAILYRTNSQSRVFEEVFGHRGIPYLLVGTGFYDRKEIKDIRAYLQLLYNPLDDTSLERILNEPPRGIGEKARVLLFDSAAQEGVSCFEMLRRMAEAPARFGSAVNKLVAFHRLMEGLRARALVVTVRTLVDEVLEKSGYRERLENVGDIEAESRLENLRELSNVAAEFEGEPGIEGLQGFLERVSLRSQSDEIKDEAGRVTLMTIHNAKGLEFPVVFLAGMEEGLFPHSRTLENPVELEEERRLCYVGMTRAMNRLYLTRARRRRMGGEYRPSAASSFLREIPSELLKGQRGLGIGAIARRYGMGLGGEDSEPRGGLAGRQGFPSGFQTGLGGAVREGKSRSLPPSWRTEQEDPGFHREQARADAHDEARDEAPEDASSDEPVSRGRSVRSASGGSGDGAGLGDLKVGRRVFHPLFGEGSILSREGPDDNPRLTIRFLSGGTKKLLARYSGLELIYR